MSELKIPERFQPAYDQLIERRKKRCTLEVFWTDGKVIEFIEEIARLETEKAEMKAKVARLSAPVSDEEWVPAVTGLVTFRQSFNKIIAARAGGE